MQSNQKKEKMDMLHGSIWNKLIYYALPVAATGILEQLFNASDVAIVGNFAGSAKTIAVAAVGANSPIIGLILNLFIGIALGTNVVIANAIGREDEKTIHKAVHTSIIMAIVGGLIVMIIGELLIGHLLKMLNVPDDVFPYALLYIRIYLIGMPVILLYNFEAAIFRSVGETKIPLQVLAISGVLNVGLNIFFVLVLKMTVNGVATATVIANMVSSLLLFIKLIRTKQVIQIKKEEITFDRELFIKIMEIGLPAGIQTAVFAVANIVIQSAINSLGTIVMAASSAALNIEICVYDILNSFSQACTTFVGQNYGAGNWDRIKKGNKFSILGGSFATFIACILLIIAMPVILKAFTKDTAVAAQTLEIVKVTFPFYFFYTVLECFSSNLRGFGKAFLPMVVTVVSFCGFRIAALFVLMAQNPSPDKVALSYPISWGIAAIAMAVLYVRNRSGEKAL